jgi:hypothetical protein
LASGATATKNADGGTSIVGRLSDAAIAEQAKGSALMAAGPLSITCSAQGSALECSAVVDDDVIRSVKGGANVYQRTVRVNITQSSIDDQVPRFAADELTCRAADDSSVMECFPASVKQPSVGAGDTTIATYVPLHLTFDGDHITQHLEHSIIPLAPRP